MSSGLVLQAAAHHIQSAIHVDLLREPQLQLVGRYSFYQQQ